MISGNARGDLGSGLFLAGLEVWKERGRGREEGVVKEDTV